MKLKNKIYTKVLLIAISIFIVDQAIKNIFINGFSYEGSCISFVLTFNRGVAFSMFAFLGDYLKYIQLFLISSMAIYMILHQELIEEYFIPSGLLFGAALSNLYDRFVEIGVVDYVYWHCGFDFAIFNLADVVIDIAVVLILYIHFKKGKNGTNTFRQQ